MIGTWSKHRLDNVGRLDFKVIIIVFITADQRNGFNIGLKFEFVTSGYISVLVHAVQVVHDISNVDLSCNRHSSYDCKPMFTFYMEVQ